MSTGTLRKILIDDLSYDAAGDADLNETLTKFENSLIITSGKAVIKQEKRAQQVEDVVLITNAGDRDRLVSFADGGGEGPMSYTDRAGNVARFVGTINVDSNQTMESRTTISFLPTEERTNANA